MQKSFAWQNEEARQPKWLFGRRTTQPELLSTPQDRLIAQDRLRVVKEIVNSLPEKQRVCMQLRDFEGKQYKEIAIVLGITEEQVKTNIFRARQTVKQQFQKIEQYGL